MHTLTGMLSWPCSQTCSLGYGLKKGLSGMLVGRVSRVDLGRLTGRARDGLSVGQDQAAILTRRLSNGRAHERALSGSIISMEAVYEIKKGKWGTNR
jgi:hypothetical protein